MPIYEYACAGCGTSFEELILRASDEEELVCPSCGGEELDRLLSAAVCGSGSKSVGGGSRPSCSTGGG